ncbi:MAG: hypothetical protein L0Y75_10955, partial [Acidobacteria bacterium]|nr:hypothetical protein [Acidobacteriota bacterium]
MWLKQNYLTDRTEKEMFEKLGLNPDVNEGLGTVASGIGAGISAILLMLYAVGLIVIFLNRSLGLDHRFGLGAHAA